MSAHEKGFQKIVQHIICFWDLIGGLLMNAALSLARKVMRSTPLLAVRFLGLFWLLYWFLPIMPWRVIGTHTGIAPHPRTWKCSLELQWYLYGAVFLLAAAYTLKANNHIHIDVVSNSLKINPR